MDIKQTTKLELFQEVQRLATENAALRAQLSERSAQIDILRASPRGVSSVREAMAAARAEAMRSGKPVRVRP